MPSPPPTFRPSVPLLIAALVLAIAPARAQDGVQVVGQTPAEVETADALPGVQDGALEVRIGGGTVIGQPEDPDDPRDTPDGDDPRDVPLPDNVCGPDVTAAMVVSLQRAFKRLQALSDDEKGAYDGPNFMYANGTNIDLVPDDIDLPEGGDRCPRGICKKYGNIQPATVTIGGHCLPAHISNDILFGFEAYMLDVPWAIAVLGAQYAETSSYAGWHWEPPTSLGAYAVGWSMATSMSAGEAVTEAAIKERIENTRVGQPKRLGGVFAYGVEEKTLLEWVASLESESYVLQCAPCPEPCTSGFMKDGTTQPWTLNNGQRVEYQP